MYQNETYPDDMGYIVGEVDENNNMTVTAVATGNTGSGVISSDGSVTITFGSGTSSTGGTATWTGTFRVAQNGIVGTGTWESSLPSNGTWQVWRKDLIVPLDEAGRRTACDVLMNCFNFTREFCMAGLKCQSAQSYATSDSCNNHFEHLLSEMIYADSCGDTDEAPPDMSEGGCFPPDACYSSDIETVQF